MSFTVPSSVVAILAASIAFGLIACSGQQPHASINDVRVFRQAELKAVNNELRKATSEPSQSEPSPYVTQRMIDFFLTPYDPAAQQSRIDTMISNSQRAAAFAKYVEATLELSASVPPASPNPPAELQGKLSEQAKLIATQLGLQSIDDSPYDTIDRANDLYTAFFAKLLRATTDSRLKPLEPQPPEPNASRWTIIALAFEVHIDAGSEPNTMVGVRLKTDTVRLRDQTNLIEGDEVGKYIKVLRLHPTRMYDLEAHAHLQDSLAAVHAAMKAPNIGTAASAKLLDESASRRRFLSRLPKTASWADATEREFGWSFYPSNLVSRRSAWFNPVDGFEAAVVYGDDANLYAYLEGGARDCLAFVMVDRDVSEIEFQVSDVIQRLPPFWSTSQLSPKEQEHGIVRVPLD